MFASNRRWTFDGTQRVGDASVRFRPIADTRRPLERSHDFGNRPGESAIGSSSISTWPPRSRNKPPISQPFQMSTPRMRSQTNGATG